MTPSMAQVENAVALVHNAMVYLFQFLKSFLKGNCGQAVWKVTTRTNAFQ